jgi:hypothetical protein
MVGRCPLQPLFKGHISRLTGAFPRVLRFFDGSSGSHGRTLVKGAQGGKVG